MSEDNPSWDPAQYLRYADQRGRAFLDLIARVDARSPEYVVDLGCGPGNLTAVLAERWPNAEVIGVDASPEMIEAARRSAPAAAAGSANASASPRRPTFELGDLRTWRPSRPVDVLISNATLQWVPGYLDLLPALLEMVAPGGWFAFQVPGNFGEPSHRLLRELASEPPWSALLTGQAFEPPSSHDPEDYLDALAGLGCTLDAWETTYLFVLSGDDPVLEWMKGTGLRPYLGALADAGPEVVRRFEAEYGKRLRTAYPRRSYGTVLPYRRVFVVAHKASA